MSYFIFDGILELDKIYVLRRYEANHLLNSRRLKTKDRFLIQDNIGNRFDAIIKSHKKSELTFVPEFLEEIPPPSNLRLEILQAITKEKAIDLIIQKSTELGVNRLDFFCGKYSPVSYKILKNRNQLDRWKRISLEASKQCGRQFPPEIFFHKNLSNALEEIKKCQHSWIITSGITSSFKWEPVLKNKKIFHRILIGPEGGFHMNEIDIAMEAGMRPIELGPRILRSETATISAISILQFLFGDLN